MTSRLVFLFISIWMASQALGAPRCRGVFVPVVALDAGETIGTVMHRLGLHLNLAHDVLYQVRSRQPAPDFAAAYANLDQARAWALTAADGARDRLRPTRANELAPDEAKAYLREYAQGMRAFAELALRYRFALEELAALPVDQRNPSAASDLRMTIESFANAEHHKLRSRAGQRKPTQSRSSESGPSS